MNKRGLSDVVTTVIIVALSLVAIGIVWIVVQNLILDNTESISSSSNFLKLNFEIESVRNDSGNLFVLVKRTSGYGDFNALQFVITYKNSSSNLFLENTSFGMLEAKGFSIPIFGEFEELSKLEIYPAIIDSSGKLILSSIHFDYNLEDIILDIPTNQETIEGGLNQIEEDLDSSLVLFFDFNEEINSDEIASTEGEDTNWHIKKTIQLAEGFSCSDLNVSFDYWVEHSDRWANFAIGVNGLRLDSKSTGNSYNTQALTYFTNVSCVNSGDTLEVWVNSEGSTWAGYVKNFIILNSSDILYRNHGATWTSEGKNFGAYVFDGINDKLTILDDSSLDFGGRNFTISFWAYVSSTSRQAFFHWSESSDYSFGLDYNSVSTNKLGLWASSNGKSWDLISSDHGRNGIGSITFPQNEWVFIVVKRAGNEWTVTQNNVLDINVTQSGEIKYKPNPKVLGQWFSLNQYPLNGKIDELRIYNRSLSQGEIQEIYSI